ncbi:MAG: hypothetical protein IJB53_05275 [Mailhella sp.]|nr:hypothetical protein [Mailhella sp.]
MFPKKIWRYWAQGWENVPFMVQHCTESVYHYAPDWEVINLDDDNIGDYIDIPEKIKNIPNFPIQPKSDLIRLLLLKKYGGVWIDATVFLNTNFTEFMTPLYGDFFCFWRWPNKVTMSNWFLAADKNSYIAKKFSEEFYNMISSEKFLHENSKYFEKWRGSPDYLCFHQLFAKTSNNDNIFSKIIQSMKFIESTPMLIDQFNGWNKDVVHESESLLSKTPLYKLTHLIKKEDYNKESILEKLVNKINAIYTPP